MDDINKFINETIVSLGLHEEDRNGEVKNKDGWFIFNSFCYKKWFDNYPDKWDDLYKLIEEPINNIVTKYNLICKFGVKEIYLCTKNNASQVTRYCFGIALNYNGTGKYNISCIIQSDCF